MERFNGFNHSQRLGYFYGKNALVSVAVSSTGDVEMASTGAVATLEDVKKALHVTDDAQNQVVVDYLNGSGVTRVDGSQFVLATLNADYVAAHAAQMNLQRIVDVVQQRAVVLSTSDIVPVAGDITTFSNAPAGTLAVTTLTGSTVVTFLVERADVFTKDGITPQGQPTGTKEKGRNLIDDLTGIYLMSKAGAAVQVLSNAGASVAGNFGVRVYDIIPAQYE